LVRFFQAPLRILGKHDLEQPLTIADAIRIGGVLLSGLNRANGRDWLKEQNREFLTKIAELAYLSDEMEEYLFTRIKARVETAEGITEAITQVEGLMAGPGAIRRFIKEAIADVLPKAPRGRPTEFNFAGDPERFLSLSAQMNGICSQFLGLRDQFPSKSIKELLVFLQSEKPKGIELLRKHADNERFRFPHPKDLECQSSQTLRCGSRQRTVRLGLHVCGSTRRGIQTGERNRARRIKIINYIPENA
jgi:hypothetical protein